MSVKIEGSLDTYLTTATEITSALIKEDGAILRLLREFHDYFAKTLWRDISSLAPSVLFLSTNAFMIYLAGVRVAMSGHPVAAFPILRTALESACYAYLISEDPKLGEIWSNRHKGSEAVKACRDRFTGAVSAVAKDIEGKQPSGGEWVRNLYDAAINDGGHPNINSVVGHIVREQDSDGENYHRFSHVGLYSAEHWQTQRGLVACLDFALAIAVVLTRSLAQPDDEHTSKLHELNDRKNAIADQLGKRGHSDI